MRDGQEEYQSLQVLSSRDVSVCTSWFAVERLPYEPSTHDPGWGTHTGATVRVGGPETGVRATGYFPAP